MGRDKGGNGGEKADKPSQEVDKQATKDHYEKVERELQQEQGNDNDS